MKIHHPDANGGDKACYLKKVTLFMSIRLIRIYNVTSQTTHIQPREHSPMINGLAILAGSFTLVGVAAWWVFKG